MESSFAISIELNRITVRLSGPFEPEQVKTTVAELLADPNYRANMNALYDLRGLDIGAVTSDQLQRLSYEIADPSWDGTRFALVADDDDVYGMARVYTAVAGESGDQQRRVFRDVGAAEGWLNGC